LRVEQLANSEGFHEILVIHDWKMFKGRVDGFELRNQRDAREEYQAGTPG
jgi:hypothetical protein